MEKWTKRQSIAAMNEVDEEEDFLEESRGCQLTQRQQ
jgi:hypothetical protein